MRKEKMIMADFLGELERHLTDAVEEVTKKTGDAIELQKIKSRIRSLERSNERDFQDIGKMVYERFKKGEMVESSCIELCEEIEKRNDEIEKHKKEVDRRK